MSRIEGRSRIVGSRALRTLTYAVGFALIAFLVHRVGVTSVLQSLAGIRAGWLALAVFVLVVNRFWRGMLWRLYLRGVGIHLSLQDAFRAVLGGDFIGSLLVGNVGSFFRPFLLSTPTEQGGSSSAMAAVLVEQLNAFISIGVLLVSGLLYFLLSTDVERMVLATTLTMVIVYAAVVAVGFLIVKGPARLGRRLGGMLSRPESYRFLRKAGAFVQYLIGCRDGVQVLLRDRRRMLIGLAMQFLVNSVMMALAFWVLLMAMDIRFRFGPLLFLPCVANSLSVVPVSPRGLGFVEGFAVALFSRFGLAASAVMSLYLLARTINVIVSLVLGGIVAVRVGGRKLEGQRCARRAARRRSPSSESMHRHPVAESGQGEATREETRKDEQ